MHAQDLQNIEPVNTPSGWGGAHKALLLTDGCLGKESKFSFRNIALFRFPMVQWLDLHLFAYEQHKLDSMSNKKEKGDKKEKGEKEMRRS